MRRTGQATDTGRFIGLDGCRAGWFAAAIDARGRHACGCFASVDVMWQAYVKPAAVLIDIPIGLSSTGSAERTVDGLARALLKPRRQASIFTPPCREALSAGTYAEACRINQRICGRKISIQTWHITAKIKEVDDFLQATPGARGILRETHPEICFWSLAGGKPLRYAKKSAEGRRERLSLLQAIYPSATELYSDALARFTRRAVDRDDILDALVNAVTATRLNSSGLTLPETPPRDRCGLPMEMVYLRPMPPRPRATV